MLDILLQVSRREIRINWGQGIVGYVAQTGVSCNVKNCYEDPRLVYTSSLFLSFSSFLSSSFQSLFSSSSLHLFFSTLLLNRSYEYQGSSLNLHIWVYQ